VPQTFETSTIRGKASSNLISGDRNYISGSASPLNFAVAAQSFSAPQT